MTSLRKLQIATAILALIPIVSGLLTMLGVDDPLYERSALPRDALLDSNLRFFGGVWLGLGIAVLWMVSRLVEQTVLFRVIWGAIFLGGIGRLLSALLVEMPPVPFMAFTVLEIVGAPLFIYWQHRVATTMSGR